MNILIKFVGKISSQGSKRIINIPKELIDEINNSVEYYKIYLIPIELNIEKDIIIQKKNLKKLKEFWDGLEEK